MTGRQLMATDDNAHVNGRHLAYVLACMIPNVQRQYVALELGITPQLIYYGLSKMPLLMEEGRYRRVVEEVRLALEVDELPAEWVAGRMSYQSIRPIRHALEGAQKDLALKIYAEVARLTGIPEELMMLDSRRGGVAPAKYLVLLLCQLIPDVMMVRISPTFGFDATLLYVARRHRAEILGVPAYRRVAVAVCRDVLGRGLPEDW
jgi:hypothetical protein